MPILIRDAELADLDWLIKQLREFSEFAGTKYPLFDDIVIARNGLIRLTKDHVVMVAHLDGERLGFIAGVLTPNLLNPKIKVLAELFWWVRSNLRGSLVGGRAGQLLLDTFIEKGRELEVQWITLALEAKSPVRETALTRRGARKHETAFLIEV